MSSESQSKPSQVIAPAPPRALTAAQWSARAPAEREAFVVQVNATLTEQARLSPEGRAHGRARSAALDRLSRHFSQIGRRIYLADELAVHYPDEPVFVPDILAVLDVEDPGDQDERMAWVVAEEGRGLDFVLEVLVSGDRGKDLVRNVDWYARLGIAEYFVYDRRQMRLLAWRQPHAGATGPYRQLQARFGRLGSRVLGLELAVQGGLLRFYSGDAELPGSGELVERLGQMVDELQARKERAEQERERAEQERERERLRGLAEQRQAVRRILEARGLPCPPALAAALEGQTDAAVLGDWIVQAAIVTTGEEIRVDLTQG